MQRPASSFFAHKKSRKSHPELARSEITLCDQEDQQVIHFSAERTNKQHSSGQYASYVKNAYADAKDTATHVIKKYEKSIFKQDADAKSYRHAERNAIILEKLFHRTGMAYQHRHKQYLLMEKCAGHSLDDMRPKLLMQKSIEDRLLCALSLTTDVACMHAINMIHRDIKPANVMIDGNTAKLIDFDGATILGEQNEVPAIYTTWFLDLSTAFAHARNMARRESNLTPFCSSLFNDRSSDVYALGLTLAHLFPDIFTIENVAGEQQLAGMVFYRESLKVTLKPGYDEKHPIVAFIFNLIAEQAIARPQNAMVARQQLAIIADRKYGISVPALVLPDETTKDTMLELFNEVDKKAKRLIGCTNESSAEERGLQVNARLGKNEARTDAAYAFARLLTIVKKTARATHHKKTRDMLNDLSETIDHIRGTLKGLHRDEVIRLSKIFFYIALFPQATDETPKQKDNPLCQSLNEPVFQPLKDMLFPNIDKVTVNDIRVFVRGYSDIREFSFYNRQRVLKNYFHFDNNQDEPLRPEQLAIGFKARRRP